MKQRVSSINAESGMKPTLEDITAEPLETSQSYWTHVMKVNGNNSPLMKALKYFISRRLSYVGRLVGPTFSKISSEIREAAEHFSLAFFPWVNPTASDQEKEDNQADGGRQVDHGQGLRREDSVRKIGNAAHD